MLNNFISKDKYMKLLQLAIFTNNEFYYNLSYDGKIEFVNQVRKKLAGKVRALTPDKLNPRS